MFCKTFLHTGGIAEADTCSMDSYIEQTNIKLQTNIVNDIKKEIDSLSLEIAAVDSHLTNVEEDTTRELDNLNSIMKRIENTNSMIESELEELKLKMDKMEIVITKLDDLHSRLIKFKQEISRELDELESNIGEKLDKLHGQKCSCTCSGIDIPTDSITLPSPLPTEKPTEEQSPCEGTGWRRVAYLNMADPDASCPLGWKLNTFDSQRVCGRASDDSFSCDPTTFSVGGEEYSQVCGKIKAYQFETPLGFLIPADAGYHIDTHYVDGVSLTHGSPRQHIWTFGAGAYEENFNFCPCSLDKGYGPRVPYFVGKDYFCESGRNRASEIPPTGFISNDPLWDGKDCSANPACCTFNTPPYFLKELEAPTTDGIEARICLRSEWADIMVEEIELYVKWISSLTQSTAFSNDNDIDQSVKLVHDNNWARVQGCSYSTEANVCMQSPHVFLL